MKKLLCLLLSLALFAGAAPRAFAETGGTFLVGQTAYSYENDAAGTGWRYHAQSRTVTLDGLVYAVDDYDNYLEFSNAPEGFRIVLAEDSFNRVGMMDAGEAIILDGSGTLEVNTIYGSVTVNGGTLQGGCIYGDALTVNAGAVVLDRTKALASVAVHGGSLTVGELDTYALEIHGGSVETHRLSNCNGTSVSDMQYCLTGGSLTMNNPDENEQFGIFMCVAYQTSPRLLEQALGTFVGTMTDENGRKLTLRYSGYEYREDETVEDMDGTDETYFDVVSACLQKVDGTVARYAVFTPAAACTHGGEVRYLYDEEGHWQACAACGAGLAGTKEAHLYRSFGEREICVCDAARDSVHSAEAAAAEMALYFWGTGMPMGYELQEVLDGDQNGKVSLKEIAGVQFAAQGMEVPEEFTVLGMSYLSDGRAQRVLSQKGVLSDGWKQARLYLIDSESGAPLTAPVSLLCP